MKLWKLKIARNYPGHSHWDPIIQNWQTYEQIFFLYAMRINCSHVRITESTGLSIFPMTEINQVSHKKFNMPKAEHHPGGRVLLFGSPPLKLWFFWGEEWVPGFYRYPFTLLPRLPRRSEQQIAHPHPNPVCGDTSQVPECCGSINTVQSNMHAQWEATKKSQLASHSKHGGAGYPEDWRRTG